MFDWQIFFDNLVDWVQIITTLSFMSIVMIGCICYFLNKKLMRQCVILAVFILIITRIMESIMGIHILELDLLSFFTSWFQ